MNRESKNVPIGAFLLQISFCKESFWWAGFDVTTLKR